MIAVVVRVAPCGIARGQEFASREKLRAHSDEFRREVIRVTDGVYVAVGYSASNVTLIDGDTGSILVDAKRTKAQALTELGERQINATARNYYLSSAQYLLRDIPPQ